MNIQKVPFKIHYLGVLLLFSVNMYGQVNDKLWEPGKSISKVQQK
jgi:hypothetical protein